MITRQQYSVIFFIKSDASFIYDPMEQNMTIVIRTLSETAHCQKALSLYIYVTLYGMMQQFLRYHDSRTLIMKTMARLIKLLKVAFQHSNFSSCNRNFKADKFRRILLIAIYGTGYLRIGCHIFDIHWCVTYIGLPTYSMVRASAPC